MWKRFRVAQIDYRKHGLSSEFESYFAAEDILQQLNRILDSPDFNGTRQQRAFLTYVVSQTMAGNSENVKGYTVATQVFGRNEDFDQAIDPIVSIQANKLRRALERYYLLSGREDEILIEIPLGTYVPVFRKRITAAEIQAFQAGEDPGNCLEDSWPKVLIQPFRNLTNSPDKQYLGSGFATALASEISRFQSFCVLRYGPEGRNKRSADIAARFVVEGDIWEDETGLKLVVNLVDVKQNRQIWSDTQWFRGDLTQIIAYQEEVAAIVGAKVAGEEGIISRILSSESRNKQPTQMQTYEAILQYHEYEQTPPLKVMVNASASCCLLVRLTSTLMRLRSASIISSENMPLYLGSEKRPNFPMIFSRLERLNICWDIVLIRDSISESTIDWT